MKLVLSKGDENTITIKMKIDSEEHTFSYVEMIKQLCKNNEFEETEFGDGFNDAEKEKLNSMLTSINSKITSLESE